MEGIALPKPLLGRESLNRIDLPRALNEQGLLNYANRVLSYYF